MALTDRAVSPETGVDFALPAVAAQTRWSALNGALLDRVASDASWLRRAHFEEIVAGTPELYSLQPWPFFIGPSQRDELAEISLGVDGVMRTVLERFFRNDHARIIEFYRANNASSLDNGKVVAPIDFTRDMMTLLLEPPNAIEAVPSRADFVDSPDGLKCVEANIGGNLGGLQVEQFRSLYLDAGPIADFIRQSGAVVEPPNVLDRFFAHIVEHSLDTGVYDGREPFGLAMVLRRDRSKAFSIHCPELYTQRLREVLADYGAGDGEVFLCQSEEFVESPRGLLTGGRRIHAAVEQSGIQDLRLPYRYFKRGMLDLFSTPATHLLSDKRNFALLSSHATSDEFTAAERDIIAKHIPWSRRIEPSMTTFRDKPFRIPQDVSACRSELVLKKARSSGGVHVYFGERVSQADWDALIERALREWDWIVQESVACVPYWFQVGEHGARRHDVVWGLYAFGDMYGGAFLRIAPLRGTRDVINVQGGAEVAMVLEVDR